MRWLVILLAIFLSMLWAASQEYQAHKLPELPLNFAEISFLNDSSDSTTQNDSEGSHLVCLFNILSYLGVIFGTYALGHLAYSKRVGLFAASICALYPSFILALTIEQNTLFFTMIVIWTLVCGWVGMQRYGHTTFWLILAGVLAAFSLAIHPHLAFFLLAIVVSGISQKLNWDRIIPRFLLIISVMSIFYLAIDLSYHFMKTPSDTPFITDNSYQLKIANLEKIDEMAPLIPMRKSFVDNSFNPIETIQNLVKKTAHAFGGEFTLTHANRFEIINHFGNPTLFAALVLTNLSYYAVVLLALIYLIRSRRLKVYHPSDSFFGWAILLLAAPLALINESDVWHMPMIPLLLLYTAKCYHLRLSHCLRP